MVYKHISKISRGKVDYLNYLLEHDNLNKLEEIYSIENDIRAHDEKEILQYEFENEVIAYVDIQSDSTNYYVNVEFYEDGELLHESHYNTELLKEYSCKDDNKNEYILQIIEGE